MVDDSLPPGRSPLFKRLSSFSLAFALGWTVVVGGSILWSVRLHEAEMAEIAKATTNARFEQGRRDRSGDEDGEGMSRRISPEPLLDAAARSFSMTIFSHGSLWFLGLGGIAFGRRRLAAEIERRERAEVRIRHLANHDDLTSLPNRNLFFERLKRSIARSNRSGWRTALLFIDIDGFKPINDRLGHDAGDQILSEIAERLQEAVRETDTVARIGGDEFAVILSDLPDIDVVARIANQMLVDLNAPFRLPQDDVTLGACIGVSLYPDDAEKSEELLTAAAEAMLEVKNLGKNGFSFVSGPIRTFQPWTEQKLRRKVGGRH